MTGKQSCDGSCSIPKSCPNCNTNQFIAERLDFWQAAKGALNEADWPDDYEVDPQDVLALALFLAGETG